MIARSTPSSITWKDNLTGLKIDFHGEWTLEPKFYLDVPETAYWYSESNRTPITPQNLTIVLKMLLIEAHNKGWVIELSKPLPREKT